MDTKVLEAKKQCDDLIVRTWDEIKNDLYTGKVRYDDLDALLKYTFLKQFDDMFRLMEESYGKRLSEILYLCRAATGKFNNYERFIPKEKYKSLNRFNPPGEMFIYLGIFSESNVSKDDKLNKAEETCLKEVRAVKGSEISLCRFKIEDTKRDKKIIDISIADEQSFDVLNKEMEVIFRRIELSNNANWRIQGKVPRKNKNDLRKIIEEKSGNGYELSKQDDFRKPIFAC